MKTTKDVTEKIGLKISNDTTYGSILNENL